MDRKVRRSIEHALIAVTIGEHATDGIERTEHAIIDLLIMFRGRKATVEKFLRDEADKVEAGEYDDEVEATNARRT